MELYVKNTGSDQYSFADGKVIIPPESNTKISSYYWFPLILDIEFIKNLRNSNLSVSDGVTEYKYPDSEIFLRQLINSDNIPNRDVDGAMITRNKAAQKGWTFCSLSFEFSTARLSDSLYSKNYDGTNRDFITLKAYDENDNEVTEPGALGVNYTTICKTIIDFEPPYDYEIIGGDLRTLSEISSDMRLWIIAVPDIPANMGGSKVMGGGINLRYLAPGNVWSVDGRVSKYAVYHPVLHTNKIRILLKYPPGVAENLQVIVQIYKL